MLRVIPNTYSEEYVYTFVINCSSQICLSVKSMIIALRIYFLKIISHLLYKTCPLNKLFFRLIELKIKAVSVVNNLTNHQQMSLLCAFI